MASRQQSIYSEYLKHPLWQKLRIEVLERDGFKCRKCGKSIGASSLEVHHKQYHPGKRPWEYPPEELISLCRTCHELFHFLKENGGDLSDYDK